VTTADRSAGSSAGRPSAGRPSAGRAAQPVTPAVSAVPAAPAGLSRRRAAPPGRLVRLHLASRGIPACLLVLAACAVALRIVLHWTPRSGAGAREIPLLLEAAAAAVIGMCTRSPFGEPERATGRWLPVLRLGTAAALTAAAFGLLAAGSAAAHLDYGYLGLLRDLAGMTGIALLAAAVAGGSLSWIGPAVFWTLALLAVGNDWATPWTWPGRLPGDRGAALCAALVFAAGVIVITVRGARDSPHE
jgi:hypothetical protein